MDDLLDELLLEQTVHGAFRSTVDYSGDMLVDETCFVTAQVALILTELTALRRPLVNRLRQAQTIALDFVEACACPEVTGAYRFYPHGLDSARLPIPLVADADDTALAWLALLRSGRRNRAQACKVLPILFERLQVVGTQRGDAPWVRSGMYRTWFDSIGGPADIGVNINVLAVFAEAGCHLPDRVARLSQAINGACSLVGFSNSSLRVLAPFYADVTEVAIALDRAVSAGVTALAPSAARASFYVDRDRDCGRPLDRPLYCNVHGRPLWRSTSLQRARLCRDLAVGRIS